jgi:hypothetical protein
MSQNVRMVKETNVPSPQAPIELHTVVPGSEINGELLRPIVVGERISVDVTNSSIKDVEGRLLLSTPVASIQETEEANIVRVTTANSVYLVTYL